MEITAFTSLFLSSKNTEVEPLSLGDVKSYLLGNKFSKE